MTFQPDNEKLGIYNCNSKNPHEEDLPIFSELEKINEQKKKENKDAEVKTQLVKEQLAKSGIEERKTSITQFFEAIFPGRDITSYSNGINWRWKFLGSNKRKNNEIPYPVSEIEKYSQNNKLQCNTNIIDTRFDGFWSSEVHFQLAYGEGTIDEDVTQGHILFYESDAELNCFGRSLLHKLEDWKLLGLPKPTVCMFTGGKGFHMYWVLRESVPKQRLAEIQIQIHRAGKHLISDGWDWNTVGVCSTKTLRAPGFLHHKTKVRSFAFDYSGEYYDIEDFEKLFPIESRKGEWSGGKGDPINGYWLPYKSLAQTEAEAAEKKRLDNLKNEENKRKWEERRKQYQLQRENDDYQPQDIDFTGKDLSLLDLIAKTSLDTFHSNGTPGDNNRPSFLLAYDLFGCEDWAKRNGINLIDSAERLFADYGIRVYPNDPGEINGKMNAARGKSPIGGDDRVRKRVEYLHGYRRSSNKLKNLALKTSKKREEEKSEAVEAKNSDSNTTPDDNKNDNSKFPPVVVEGVVNNSGRGFGKGETFKKEANSWKPLTVLKKFCPKSLINCKEELVKNEETGGLEPELICRGTGNLRHSFNTETVKKWVYEIIPDYDANESNGIVGYGDFRAIRYRIASTKEIRLTDSDDTSFEYGFFVPTDGLEDGVSDTLFKSVSLLREFIKDVKEDGFKFKLIIEQREDRYKLIQFLKQQGLDKYLFVENEKGVQRGAVFWTQQLEQKPKANITINQRYLGDLNQILDEHDYKDSLVVYLKSDTGTGKTHSILRYIERKKEQGKKIKILSIYSLVQLVEVVCKKQNLVHYQDGAGKYSSNELALKDDNFNGLGLCANSLKKDGYANFDPELWANYDGCVLLSLDEIEATLDAIANSSIISNKAEIYDNLKAIIQAVLRNKNGRILVSDANLSQYTIDFINRYLPENTKTCVVENEYRHHGNRKALVYNSKDHLLSELNDNKDELNFIATDCRRILTKGAYTSSRAIEHMLDNNCNRCDGYTSHTSDNSNYSVIKNIEVLDKQGKLDKSQDITPAAAIGISIENTEFNAVYGFFKGICDGECIHQMLERDRSDAPRKIYVENCRNGFHSPFYAASKETLELQEEYRTGLHTKALGEAAGGSKAAKQAVSNINDEPAALKKWRHKKTVYHYWHGKHLRVNAIAQLQDRGYEVQIVEKPSDTENTQKIGSLVEKMKIYCEETWEADKRAIAKEHKEVKRMLENGEEDKLIKLDQQQDRTAAQHTLVECYKIAKWTKSLTSNDFDMNPQHVELFVHHRKQVENGVNVWANLRGEGDIAYALTCANDVVKSLFTKRLKRELRTSTAVRDLLIEVLNVPGIITEIQQNNGFISNADEFCHWINKRLLENYDEIYSLLGIQLDRREDRPVTNIKKILKACSYTFKKAERDTTANKAGKRVRHYELQQPEPEVLQIWVSWTRWQLAHQDFQNWTGEMKEAYSKLLALEAEIAKSSEQSEPTAIAQGELATVT